MRGVEFYIGDGATLLRSMVRQRGSQRIGHAAISAQLDWCAAEGVLHAIFTHCGSGIVGSDGRRMNALVRRLGNERGIDARLAHDGLTLKL